MTTQLTVVEIASRLKWSVPTVRRWLWFTRSKPAGRRPKWVGSSRGRRKVVSDTYDSSILDELRRAHEETP